MVNETGFPFKVSSWSGEEERLLILLNVFILLLDNVIHLIAGSTGRF